MTAAWFPPFHAVVNDGVARSTVSAGCVLSWPSLVSVTVGLFKRFDSAQHQTTSGQMGGFARLPYRGGPGPRL